MKLKEKSTSFSLCKAYRGGLTKKQPNGHNYARKQAKAEPTKTGVVVEKKENLPMITNGICNLCGNPAKWVKVKSRWRPVNPDGTKHFDLCLETQHKLKQYAANLDKPLEAIFSTPPAKREPVLMGVTKSKSVITPFSGLPWE